MPLFYEVGIDILGRESYFLGHPVCMADPGNTLHNLMGRGITIELDLQALPFSSSIEIIDKLMIMRNEKGIIADVIKPIEDGL